MSTILEVWDRIINSSLTKNSFKKIGHQQLSFRIVLYAFWTLFLLTQ